MSFLVDTSIWIDYFRSGKHSTSLDQLIEENLIVTNELILTELIPFLTIRKKKQVISLLRLLPLNPLNINWIAITHLQTKCLQKGLTGIGISDLIITQNAIQNHATLYTLDKHFNLLKSITSLSIYNPD